MRRNRSGLLQKKMPMRVALTAENYQMTRTYVCPHCRNEQEILLNSIIPQCCGDRMAEVELHPQESVELNLAHLTENDVAFLTSMILCRGAQGEWLTVDLDPVTVEKQILDNVGDTPASVTPETGELFRRLYLEGFTRAYFTKSGPICPLFKQWDW